MSLILHLIVFVVLLIYITAEKARHAEFGRMSYLVGHSGWNFSCTDYGVTHVFKEGENTSYSFSGIWMYRMLKKYSPESERPY